MFQPLAFHRPVNPPGLLSVLIGSLSYLHAALFRLFSFRTKRSAGALRKRWRIE